MVSTGLAVGLIFGVVLLFGVLFIFLLCFVVLITRRTNSSLKRCQLMLTEKDPTQSSEDLEKHVARRHNESSFHDESEINRLLTETSSSYLDYTTIPDPIYDRVLGLQEILVDGMVRNTAYGTMKSSELEGKEDAGLFRRKSI